MLPSFRYCDKHGQGESSVRTGGGTRPLADEDAFRSEVQQFLAAHFPAELKGKANALAGVDGPTDETPAQTRWRKAVGERGWGTPTWPKEYGGGGLTKAQAKIVEQDAKTDAMPEIIEAIKFIRRWIVVDSSTFPKLMANSLVALSEGQDD